MEERKARRVLQELANRSKRKARLKAEEILFAPQQLEFVVDPSKRKAALCSRRAGKSFSEAFILTELALNNERSICPYITMTRENARNILWPALQDLNEQLELGMDFKQNTGDVVFRNGSRIVIRGAEDRRQIEKLRGPKYPGVVIDEAQSFPAFLKELIEDVLEPATMDYNGPIVLSGTPNASCTGTFYRVTTGHPDFRDWSIHRWTFRDNPHIPGAEEWISRKMANSGWTTDHPTYQREYCGVWIKDNNTLVYKFTDERNLCTSAYLKEGSDWEYTLGIDLGFNDPTAWVVVAYSQNLGQAVVVDSYKESELLSHEVADKTAEFLSSYDISKIVADTGGFGKGYAEEMKRRFSIPVLPAQKQNKVTFIEMLNGELQAGKIKIAEQNEELLGEISLLQWDNRSLERGKFVFDKSFSDHLCDALLYAWRECQHHHVEPLERRIEPGTPEFFKKREDDIEQRLIERCTSDQNATWWEKARGGDAKWTI
jgi:hypothetical protein